MMKKYKNIYFEQFQEKISLKTLLFYEKVLIL